MISEWCIEKHLEGRSGLIDVLSRNISARTEEIHEKPLRITGVPAEIQTEHLSDTSIASYSCANVLGSISHPVQFL
jgi:hypothetical protein